MIRRATLADSAKIRELVKSAWAQAHGHLPIDEVKLLKTVQRYLSNKQAAVFLSVVSDEVRGMLAATISPLEIAKGKASTDHCFYCTSGEGKQLIEEYVKWAKNKGAVMINLCVSSGEIRADELIESCGFVRKGGNYYLE